MRRTESQRGSSLIMLIGIIAALAIMATSLVALTGNVHHNTYADRMEVKADTVTEATLDVGMADMSATWPEAAGEGPTLDAAAFRGMFSTGQFPDPASGTFATYSYFDNPWSDGTYHAPYTAANPPAFDQNADQQMYLVAQAGVGPGAARMQALVRVTFFSAEFPRGVAVFTGANLLSNGGGNNPKIHVEVAPPTGTVSCRAAGDIEEDGQGNKEAVFDQATMIGLEGAAAGTVEDVFPPPWARSHPDRQGPRPLLQRRERGRGCREQPRERHLERRWADGSYGDRAVESHIAGTEGPLQQRGEARHHHPAWRLQP